MGEIIKVDPWEGKAGDGTWITLSYEEKLGDPKVTHVLFFDDAEANFNEQQRDKANRKIIIYVQVPRNAETGPIEVNLEGDLPFSTQKSFKVIGPTNPFKVTQIRPQMPAEGYEQGWNLWITTSRAQFVSQTPKVYFPRTSYGPPTQLGTISGKTENPAMIKVKVPARTGESIVGKIKVQDGQESALSRLLKFR
jgi:hypothetical protein